MTATKKENEKVTEGKSSVSKKETSTRAKTSRASASKPKTSKALATKSSNTKANPSVLESKIKILNEKAEVPSRAHESDTGYDIKMIDVEKVDGDTIFFKTGISIEPPKGYYFEVYPRSSISKLPISLANSVGIIDSEYRGEILIPVRVHHQNVGFKTKRESYPNGIVEIWESRPQSMLGLARLILMKKPKMFQLVLREKKSCTFKESVLTETERGDGGFGSTD